VASAAEAEEMARGMRQTLAHFPTLEVQITEVDAAEVPEARTARIDGGLPIAHLLHQGSSACGTQLGTADAAVDAALWPSTDASRHCAICSLIADESM